MMLTDANSVTFVLTFVKGYIAHPYWPEMEKVINIQKESGMNRARGSDRRAKALESYLKAAGITVEQYADLIRRAARPFYTADSGEIVIPEHHVYGMLANTADAAPRAMKAVSRDQIRSAIEVAWPVMTGKKKADGVWSRFVVVTGSGGFGKISNQRALRENPYIEKFSCEMTLRHDPDMVSVDRLSAFVEFGGREVGIGASRKMGWGRFTVHEK